MTLAGLLVQQAMSYRHFENMVQLAPRSQRYCPVSIYLMSRLTCCRATKASRESQLSGLRR
jgi:hypothetical protein